MRRVDSGRVTSWSAMRYENMGVSIQTAGYTLFEKMVNKSIEEHGKEGWELVSITPVTWSSEGLKLGENYRVTSAYMLFRRPVA